jgi:GT2 family glycosyltransferase
VSAALSVVIPTRDTRELTLACLDSLVRAAAPGGLGAALEVVVVDDASRDGTAEAIAERHPAVQVLRCESSVGFAQAANLGLARARGEVLLLLNSDTEVEPGGISALLAAMAADARLGAAGAMLHYPDGSPQWSAGRAPTLPWLFGLASGLPALFGRLPHYRRVRPPGGGRSRTAGAGVIPVQWVTGAALALRREAWEQVGPLDDGFRFYVQDLDLCLRLGAAGWKVAVVSGFRVLHHHGATIGRAAAAGGPQNPELLWGDLLRWARKSRPGVWARAAVLALAGGARLRLFGRRIVLPFVPPPRRTAWRHGTRALAAALAALRR